MAAVIEDANESNINQTYIAEENKFGGNRPS